MRSIVLLLGGISIKFCHIFNVCGSDDIHQHRMRSSAGDEVQLAIQYVFFAEQSNKITITLVILLAKRAFLQFLAVYPCFRHFLLTIIRLF